MIDTLIIAGISFIFVWLVLVLLCLFSIARYTQSLLINSNNIKDSISDGINEILEVMYKTPEQKNNFNKEYARIQKQINKKQEML